MNRRLHLIALLCFLGIGAYWSLTRGGGNVPAAAAVTQPVAPAPTLSQTEIRRQFEALERDKAATLAKLGTDEANAQLRARAGTKTFEVREQLQLARQPYWTKVLSTNWSVYKKLHAEAVGSEDHIARCTICDGRGKMDFCIMCNGTGKCQTCGGTGRAADGSPCPNCLGSKSCYLCEGTGRMACPFCDDGDIYAKLAPPPNVLPIYCQPPGPLVAWVTP